MRPSAAVRCMLSCCICFVWVLCCRPGLPCVLLVWLLQAVLRSSSGKDVWEKGTNHKADLQGSCDISLYHVFQA